MQSKENIISGELLTSVIWSAVLPDDYGCAHISIEAGKLTIQTGDERIAAIASIPINTDATLARTVLSRELHSLAWQCQDHVPATFALRDDGIIFTSTNLDEFPLWAFVEFVSDEEFAQVGDSQVQGWLDLRNAFSRLEECGSRVSLHRDDTRGDFVFVDASTNGALAFDSDNFLTAINCLPGETASVIMQTDSVVLKASNPNGLSCRVLIRGEKDE